MKRDRPKINYGNRGRLGGADSGIRRLAPTFGRVLLLTSSSKCSERFTVDSDAERLAVDLFTIDPRVRRFSAQPLTVDLIDGCLLKTRDEVAAARDRHRHRIGGRRLYTPDFSIEWHDDQRSVVEIKLEGFEGDAEYESMLRDASVVLEAWGIGFQRMIMPRDPRHPLRTNLPILKKAAARRDLWPDRELVERIQSACCARYVRAGELCASLRHPPTSCPC